MPQYLCDTDDAPRLNIWAATPKGAALLYRDEVAYTLKSSKQTLKIDVRLADSYTFYVDNLGVNDEVGSERPNG